MICVLHDWYSDGACPACSLTGRTPLVYVTAAETTSGDAKMPEKPDPEVEIDVVEIAATEPPDNPAIPKWLQRNRDGSFKFPGYPVSPTQSAQKRKLQYALDEKKEQDHALATDLDGPAVRNLLGGSS